MSDDWSVPRISLVGARAAYVGPALDLAPHRNAAATLAIARTTPFRLALRCPGTFEERPIALIPPNVRHHLQATGPMAFLYLDAMSDSHERLASWDLGELHTLILERLGSQLWDVSTLCEAVGLPSRPEGDLRMARVVRRLDSRPQDFARIADAAALAGLSNSRFQALFKQEVGMPFRRYRLWRRMGVVLQAVSEGRSLTDVALEAGFAGSSHLSTTFLEMFGLSPSQLIRLQAQIAADSSTGEP